MDCLTHRITTRGTFQGGGATLNAAPGGWASSPSHGLATPPGLVDNDPGEKERAEPLHLRQISPDRPLLGDPVAEADRNSKPFERPYPCCASRGRWRL